jgi:uncharacterized protein (DUF362 family)
MAPNDDPMSRRRFLEHASAAVGAAALGAACSSDNSEPNPDSVASAGNSAAGETNAVDAGSKPQSAGAAMPTAGTSSGAAGSRPVAGSGAKPASAAGSSADNAGAGSGVPAAGSGAAGTTSTPAGKTVVAVVKKGNVEEAVMRAIELAGGLGDIQEGQTVFIKPNAVNDRALGMTGIRTSNEVLAAVVKAVKARKPGKITVGDRSARTFPDTARILMASGMRDAALAAGADEVYAAKSPADAPEEWLLLQPPMYEVTWQDAGGLYAMRKILESDHLINVPTCKNHHYALYSLSMKAFMGGIGDSTRDPIHFRDSVGGNFNAIGRDLAILNQMFKPTMNIIDATTALVNGGPEGDGANAVRVPAGMVFASKDRIAVDAAAVSLMQVLLETANVPMPDAANAALKRDPAWKMPQVANGIERGIGVNSANLVELMFDGVDQAADIEAKFRA